jgi:release factor glutamine methyltransferase
MASLTVRGILEISEEVLRKKGIENPRLNTELLLASVLNTERINLYLDFEKPLTDDEINSYREKIKRRLSREPLQYVLRYSEFYGMRFTVTPDVLIPRPETEILVEESIKAITALKTKNIRILEIGTGTGCISIAIAANCGCTIDAIDLNERALAVAIRNARAYNLKGKINFLRKNLITSFDSFEGYGIVVSNPPYIAADEFEQLPDEIKKYEPRNALTDEKDGLSYYRKIIELATKTKNGVMCFVEIGDGKRERVEGLLIENSIKNYSFSKDLQGIDRVLKFEMPT